MHGETIIATMSHFAADRSSDDEHFDQRTDGILLPMIPVEHREAEWDEAGFDVLRKMQSQHFWYLGRHRFLLSMMKRMLKRLPASSQ